MISFFLRQLTLALNCAVALLLIGEILIPGLVLPFVNLHLLIVGVLALNLIPVEQPNRRPYAAIPVGIMLIGYTFLLLSGQGPSAMMLGMAISTIVVVAALAIL
ncbi:MAG: hypothetical protein WCK01_04955 [Candidatus Uhrbacteria bacterium]